MSRKCKVCNEVMYEGFVLDDGTDYFCSEECLTKEITWEEYLEMVNVGEAYWTEWEDD